MRGSSWRSGRVHINKQQHVCSSSDLSTRVKDRLTTSVCGGSRQACSIIRNMHWPGAIWIGLQWNNSTDSWIPRPAITGHGADKSHIKRGGGGSTATRWGVIISTLPHSLPLWAHSLLNHTHDIVTGAGSGFHHSSGMTRLEQTPHHIQ